MMEMSRHIVCMRERGQCKTTFGPGFYSARSAMVLLRNGENSKTQCRAYVGCSIKHYKFFIHQWRATLAGIAVSCHANRFLTSASYNMECVYGAAKALRFICLRVFVQSCM